MKSKKFGNVVAIIFGVVSLLLYIFKGPAQYSSQLEEAQHKILGLQEQLEGQEQLVTLYQDSIVTLDSLVKETKVVHVDNPQEGKVKIKYITRVVQDVELLEQVKTLEQNQAYKDSLLLALGQRIYEQRTENTNLQQRVEEALSEAAEKIGSIPCEATMEDEWMKVSSSCIPNDSTTIKIQGVDTLDVTFTRERAGWFRKNYKVYVNNNNPYIKVREGTTYVLDRKLKRKLRKQ